MQNLYSRLTELLGKPEGDPLVAEFFAESKEPPKLLVDREHHREHSFASSGYSLSVNEHGIVSVFLHLSTNATRSGSIKPFIGELPFRVTESDSRQDVERKMGKKPVRSQSVPCSADHPTDDYWDDYDHDSFLVRFMFCSGHPGISAISIRLLNETRSPQTSSAK